MNKLPAVPGYYSTREIMALFGWRTRAQVSATAKRRGWPVVRVGTASLYPAPQVAEYAQARQRTRLAEELGFSWRRLPKTERLLEDDGYDMDCPVCGAFALHKWPQGEAEITAWIDYLNERTSTWPWRCVNGHAGDTL